jgi:hypothetical protein
MKKLLLFVFVAIFSLSTLTAFAGNNPDTKNLTVPDKTENKLSAEEISRLTNRVDEIRDMDKTDMTAKEKRDLKKELTTIKKNVKRSGGYVYIGGSTLLLIIILIILL